MQVWQMQKVTESGLLFIAVALSLLVSQDNDT